MRMQKTSDTIVYLGVDIGKTSHAWTLVDSRGHVLEEGEVMNKHASLHTLASRLVRKFPNLCAGCEATGVYYERFAIAFTEAGCLVRVINPALTSTKALRSSMRLTKTDKQDARGITLKLQQLQGEIGSIFVWNSAERRLQALARHIQFLKKERRKLSVRSKEMSSRSFESIDVRVDLFDEEITRLESELIDETTQLHEKALSILTAIRGVGEKSASMILAEAMNLNRFDNSKAFAAFVGLDPTLKQSGTSVNGKSRLSKAGSPYLRAVLTWTSKLLVQWNPTFRTCFEHALSRGKAPGVAYGIVARKFATIVHQCVTKNEPFDPDKVGLGTRANSLTL